MHKKTRKICVIVPTHWAATMGGSQYQAGRLVSALVDDPSNEVFFLSRLTNPQYQPQNYTVVNVASKRSVARYRRIFDIPRIIHALREIRPDVIYQRVGGAYTGAAARYAIRAGCRMVWHIASDNDVLPYRDCQELGEDVVWLEKRILEYGITRSNQIVAQTKTQSRLLSANYGREATAVIPNFHPPAEETIDKTGEKKVVWIANIKRLKQPELFLQLAEDLSNIPNVRFIMIGAQSADVSWRRTFDDMTARLTNLDYMERRTQEEVNAVLAGAHLLVNTSLYEGFSNTFVQAWMRRVPVVSLNVNPDGVFDGGLLGVHSGSYTALRDDVRTLLEQPRKLEEMGRYACRYATENHSDRNIQRLIDVLFE